MAGSWNHGISWEEPLGIMEDQLQTSSRSAALCPCQHEVSPTGHKTHLKSPQTTEFPLHLLPLILSSVCEADFPLQPPAGVSSSASWPDTSKHTDSWVNSAAYSSPGKPWDRGWIPSQRSSPSQKSALRRAQSPHLAPGLAVGVE